MLSLVVIAGLVYFLAKIGNPPAQQTVSSRYTSRVRARPVFDDDEDDE